MIPLLNLACWNWASRFCRNHTRRGSSPAKCASCWTTETRGLGNRDAISPGEKQPERPGGSLENNLDSLSNWNNIILCKKAVPSVVVPFAKSRRKQLPRPLAGLPSPLGLGVRSPAFTVRSLTFRDGWGGFPVVPSALLNFLGTFLNGSGTFPNQPD